MIITGMSGGGVSMLQTERVSGVARHILNDTTVTLLWWKRDGLRDRIEGSIKCNRKWMFWVFDGFEAVFVSVQAGECKWVRRFFFFGKAHVLTGMIPSVWDLYSILFSLSNLNLSDEPYPSVFFLSLSLFIFVTLESGKSGNCRCEQALSNRGHSLAQGRWAERWCVLGQRVWMLCRVALACSPRFSWYLSKQRQWPSFKFWWTNFDSPPQSAQLTSNYSVFI